MFFLIPLVIFVVSIAAMCWIIVRKFAYLKKLEPEIIKSSSGTEVSFWAEFFPGLAMRLKDHKFHEYKLNFLAEFEKFLRRLRLLSLKLDTVTNRLIHRVRKSAVHNEGLITERAARKIEQEQAAAEINGNNGPKDPKEEEQGLIMEIAKNPKDAALYGKLGNIYMKTREWHDAAESFKKSLELEPENEATKAKLEKALQKSEKMPT